MLAVLFLGMSNLSAMFAAIGPAAIIETVLFVVATSIKLTKAAILN